MYRSIPVVTLSQMWLPSEIQLINRFIQFKGSEMYWLNKRADFWRK